MKRTLSLVIVLSLCLALLAGCGRAPLQNEEKETVSYTDDCGRTVEIPCDITKIVPTGPLAQMILFAAAPDMFVGVSSKWDDVSKDLINSKYLELPEVGEIYGKSDINLEELALLAPELIIDIGEAKGSIVEDLDSIQKQTGIPCVHIEASLETMPEAYRKLGALLGIEEKGEELAAYCTKWLEASESLMEKVGDNKVRAVYCAGEEGLGVWAKGSFHAEILDMLVDNAAVCDDISSKGTGNPVDMEQLLIWDPEFIIFSPSGGYEAACESEVWSQLTAIKNGSFVEVPYGPYNWSGNPPSVQRYLSLIWLPAVLYPEYIEYDVYSEVKNYFELFYHCDLSLEQFDALTENSFIK